MGSQIDAPSSRYRDEGGMEAGPEVLAHWRSEVLAALMVAGMADSFDEEQVIGRIGEAVAQFERARVAETSRDAPSNERRSRLSRAERIDGAVEAFGVGPEALLVIDRWIASTRRGSSAPTPVPSSEALAFRKIITDLLMATSMELRRKVDREDWFAGAPGAISLLVSRLIEIFREARGLNHIDLRVGDPATKTSLVAFLASACDPGRWGRNLMKGLSDATLRREASRYLAPFRQFRSKPRRSARI